MKKILKKVIALASAVAMTLSMSSFVSAAEDIVLEDSGSPFIKTFDPWEIKEVIFIWVMRIVLKLVRNISI